MNRRSFLLGLGGLTSLPLLSLLSPRTGPAHASESKAFPLQKSAAEWQELLSPAAYAVLFEEDTERSGSSPLDKEYGEGVYLCAACLQPLFNAATKFDSGTGWPSFWQPLPGRIATRTDYKLIWPRTEYHCTRCGGHQGHVFDDGPQPTGKRYCNNGVALRFIPAGQPTPPLRS